MCIKKLKGKFFSIVEFIVDFCTLSNFFMLVLKFLIFIRLMWL